MKAVKKDDGLGGCVEIDGAILERDIGILGKECRFIVKLLSAFQSEVFIFHFKLENKMINLNIKMLILYTKGTSLELGPK